MTAFIGAAKRGPIDEAVRMLGFADYERRFGGLSLDSEMSYAVRQFFLNGGSEAWVVRVAKAALRASNNLTADGGRIAAHHCPGQGQGRQQYRDPCRPRERRQHIQSDCDLWIGGESTARCGTKFSRTSR